MKSLPTEQLFTDFFAFFFFIRIQFKGCTIYIACKDRHYSLNFQIFRRLFHYQPSKAPRARKQCAFFAHSKFRQTCKAVERKIKFTKDENDPSVYRYVMQPDLYIALNQAKVIHEAAFLTAITTTSCMGYGPL